LLAIQLFGDLLAADPRSVPEESERQVNLARRLVRCAGVSGGSAMEVIGPAPDDGPPVRLFTVESFETFFRREYPRLVTLAYALSGSRELAEDAAQDSMITAYRRWEEIVRLEYPEAYIRKACLNHATSSLRRRVAEGRALVRLAGRPRGFAALPEDSETFWREVRRLPTKQAQAVALHYGCDLSVEETAAVLGTATGTVKSHLHRARRTLAGRLRLESGHLPADGEMKP